MGKKNYSTPTRAKARGIVAYLEKHKLLAPYGPHTKKGVLKFCGIDNYASGMRILKGRDIPIEPRRTRLKTQQALQEALDPNEDYDSRTLHNDPRLPEKRGRKPAYSQEDLDDIEELMNREPFEARRMPWGSLAHAAQVEIHHDETLHHALARRGNYNKRLEKEKQPLPPSTARARVERAKKEVEHYSDPEVWKSYFAIDEVHFSYGPSGQGYVIRSPKEVNEWWTVSAKREPKDWEEKVLHAVAIAGWGYKSKLYWYRVPGNKNGKMTQEVYIQILSEALKDLENHLGHKDFVLWQDNDSGHGKRRDSRVATWMREQGYKYCFNSSRSPDTNWIENCFKAPKSWIRRHEIWDIEDLRTLANEGWARLKQSTINEWVLSMPRRWEDVIKADGQMTAW